MQSSYSTPARPPLLHRSLAAASRLWIAALVAGCVWLVLGPSAAHAATPVSGDINANTTWTKANSPYQVTGLLHVGENATLTIEPGVQVLVAKQTHIVVYGSLVAQGTAAEPIRFAGSTPDANGWWYGIDVSNNETDPASVLFNYVVVEHAGFDQMEGYGALDIQYGSAEIRNSIFQNNGNNGVNVTLDGPFTLADSQFINNGRSAVRIDQGYGPNDPQLGNLSASGNGKAGTGFDAVVYQSVTLQTGDHTLEAMGLPYVFKGGFNVGPNARAIMAPGIEVRVDTGFYVDGDLQAIGTAEKPITITGIKKEPGGWWGLNVSGAYEQISTVELDHVILEYGGQTAYEDSANLVVSTANVTVRNSLIRNGGGHGLYNLGGAPDDVFSVLVENTTFDKNARGAVVCDDESCKQTLNNLTATGNAINAIVQRGAIYGNAVWTKTGLPYVVEGYAGINQDGTLVIDPGVEIRMAQGASFAVDGTLYAVGTAEQPIVFTGLQQQPGWWEGIRVDGFMELRYCDVGYGGISSPYPQAMVELATNTAFISQCRLHHSAEAAIRTLTNVVPVIMNNRIEENAAGLINDNGTANPLTVDARYNWWGSPSGPAHASNPGGQGNSVSDRVQFNPWLTGPDQAYNATTLLVQVGGVGRYSPGETVQYAIAYSNPTKEAVQDAVLRVALPANSEYIDSTGGLFWPDRRQVFWKLGSLAPGAGGLLSVRVTYAWGLPDGLKTAIVAQLGGKGVDASLFDVAEYLAYQPRTETGVAPLSAEQVQALRAGDAKLDAIYDQAEAGGYSFGNATERTYSTGEKLTQVISLRVAQEDVQAFIIWRLPSGSVGAALDGSSLTVYKPGQGARYSLQTKTWQELAAGEVLAAAGISWSDCMINCIEDKLPGEVAEQLIKAYSVGKKAVGCVKAAGGDKDGILECSKVLDKAIPVYGVGVELVTCNADCDECVANGQGCEDDKCHCCTATKYRCSSDDWLYGTLGIDVIMRRECKDGMYMAEVVDRTCALCDKCVMSGSSPACVSKNALAAQLGVAELTWVDAGLQPARDDLTLVSGGGDQECEECRRAKDPNAITGPAGDLLPGQWVTYTLDYENVGSGVAYDVFVVNPLSKHFDLATLAVQGANVAYSLSTSTRRIYFQVGDLQAKGQPGSKGQITYSIRLLGSPPSGTVIANQAVVHFPSVPEETPTNTAVNVIQPIAVPNQRLQVNAGQTLNITLAGQDAGNAPLSFAIVEAPIYGTLAGTPPALAYTPQPNFAGIDRLVFTAGNGTATSRRAEVVIEVARAGNDGTPPRVKWTSPANGAVIGASQKAAVQTNGAFYTPYIQIQFSEAMAASTINATTVEVKDGAGQVVPISVQYDPMLDQAVALMQKQGQANMSYSVTVKRGATDLAGNPLAADYSWSFKLGDFAPGSFSIYLPHIQQ